MHHKAFISYSHKADQRLAAALQDALQQFAKPYYTLRAFHVFRDQTDLSANPSLWPRIETALDASEFFLLLASSESAKSYWVKREIDHWLRAHQGRPLNMLLLWTEGQIVWDVNHGEFDWSITNALPRVLDWDTENGQPLRMSGVFTDQPFYVDLRWAREKAQLSLRDPEFLDNVGTIAAELHGQSKSMLVGRDVAEHKRFRRARLGAILGLTIFAIAALIFGVSAYLDRNKARSAQLLAEQRLEETNIAKDAEKQAADHERQQRQIAESRVMANAAYALSDRDPTLSLRFAEAAVLKSSNSTIGPDTTTTLSVLKAFNSGSWFYSQRFDGATDADLSRDGKRLAWIEGTHTLHLVDLHSMVDTRRIVSASNVRFLPTGNVVVWHSWSGPGTMGEITTINRTGIVLARHKFQFLAPIMCPSGQVMVPSFGKRRRLMVSVIDLRQNGIQSFDLPQEVQGLGLAGACLPNGRGVILAQTIPGILVLADLDGRRDVFSIPRNYHPRDLDFHLGDRRVAVYLSGAVQGATDAVGWLKIDRDTTSDIALRIVALPRSPAFDSGGILRFLDDGRVIAASTAGWTRLVNLDTGEIAALPDASRGTDQITVLPKDNLVALARRSGTVSIYASPDILVGRLLGELHSDGLNMLFTHLASDATGQKLLTVSRNGARLWLRPRYALTDLHSRQNHAFDALPDSALTFLRKPQSEDSRSPVAACGGTSTIRIDDLGQMSLCVIASGRIDYLATGIAKDDLGVLGTGPTGKSIYRIIGEKADRLFVLSPGMLLRFAGEEGRNHRLWAPDAETLRLWSSGTSSLTAERAH